MISLALPILGIILMFVRFYINYHNVRREVICFLDFLIILTEFAAYFTVGNFLYKICALIWCMILGSDCALLSFDEKHK